MKVSNLSFSFDRKPLFQNLNFEIASGTLFGITGPNGSGKTTLLQVLAGLLKPTRGTLTSNSVSLFLPDTGFYEDLTLQENLQFYSKLYQAANRLPAEIATWNLGSFIHQPVKFLSRGQRMRGGLCRTFLKEADTYLLDEPALGLDAPSLQALEASCIRLKSQRKRVIIAGPDLKTFASLFDQQHVLSVS